MTIKQVGTVLGITVAILAIPLIAMQFSTEVQWDSFDFVVMGTLIAGTGFAYQLISQASKKLSYKIAVGIAVLTSLLLLWVTLAVGIINSEDTPVNLLYILAPLLGAVGAALAYLKPRGMAIAAYVTAGYVFCIPFIASILGGLSIGHPDTHPGIDQVFVLNGVFAALYLMSGLFFRKATRD